MPDIPSLKDGSCDTDDLIKQYDAMIRLFFKEDPDSLSDMEYVRRTKELTWLAKEGFLRGIKL